MQLLCLRNGHVFRAAIFMKMFGQLQLVRSWFVKKKGISVTIFMFCCGKEKICSWDAYYAKFHTLAELLILRRHVSILCQVLLRRQHSFDLKHGEWKCLLKFQGTQKEVDKIYQHLASKYRLPYTKYSYVNTLIISFLYFNVSKKYHSVHKEGDLQLYQYNYK